MFETAVKVRPRSRSQCTVEEGGAECEATDLEPMRTCGAQNRVALWKPSQLLPPPRRLLLLLPLLLLLHLTGHAVNAQDTSALITGILGSLTSTSRNQGCPGECVHALTSLLCEQTLADAQCDAAYLRCCVTKSPVAIAAAGDGISLSSNGHQEQDNTSAGVTLERRDGQPDVSETRYSSGNVSLLHRIDHYDSEADNPPPANASTPSRRRSDVAPEDERIAVGAPRDQKRSSPDRSLSPPSSSSSSSSPSPLPPPPASLPSFKSEAGSGKSGGCPGSCVSPAYAAYCQYPAAAATGNTLCADGAVCCMHYASAAGPSAGQQKTARPAGGGECGGSCVSTLFSLFCNRVDYAATCASGGVCCLDGGSGGGEANGGSGGTRKAPPAEPAESGRTDSAGRVTPCSGRCLPGFMHATCLNEGGRVAIPPTNCPPATICCFRARESGSAGGGDDYTNDRGPDGPGIILDGVSQPVAVEAAAAVAQQLGAPYATPQLHSPQKPKHSQQQEQELIFVSAPNHDGYIVGSPQASRLPQPQAGGSSSGSSPGSGPGSTVGMDAGDAELFGGPRTPLVHDASAGALLGPPMTSAELVTKVANSIQCPGSCIAPLMKFTCFGSNSVFPQFKCADGYVCCADTGDVKRTLGSAIFLNQVGGPFGSLLPPPPPPSPPQVLSAGGQPPAAHDPLPNRYADAFQSPTAAATSSYGGDRLLPTAPLPPLAGNGVLANGGGGQAGASEESRLRPIAVRPPTPPLALRPTQQPSVTPSATSVVDTSDTDGSNEALPGDNLTSDAAAAGPDGEAGLPKPAAPAAAAGFPAGLLPPTKVTTASRSPQRRPSQHHPLQSFGSATGGFVPLVSITDESTAAANGAGSSGSSSNTAARLPTQPATAADADNRRPSPLPSPVAVPTSIRLSAPADSAFLGSKHFNSAPFKPIRRRPDASGGENAAVSDDGLSPVSNAFTNAIGNVPGAVTPIHVTHSRPHEDAGRLKGSTRGQLNCGQGGRHRQQRVIGGANAAAGEWCWQAAIYNEKGRYVCGGALIGPQWVLTAAHCVTRYVRNGDAFYVEVGSVDLTARQGHLRKKAWASYIHHNYNEDTLDNDIALIKVLNPFNVNSTALTSACTVCLPGKQGSKAERLPRCTVTGYGALREGGPVSMRIRQVDLPMVEERHCVAQLSAATDKQFKLPTSTFCAGGEEGHDACQGDGGSPMVCDMGGFYELKGLVSWGLGCGRRNVPGVYVKVSSFIGWVNQIISVNTGV